MYKKGASVYVTGLVVFGQVAVNQQDQFGGEGGFGSVGEILRLQGHGSGGLKEPLLTQRSQEQGRGGL